MASDHPDETRPFLHDQSTAKPAPTPIPKAQLATLCTLRIVEPIASTQLFPYVNEFISDLHLTDDPSRIGFYSGLVVRCIPTSAPLTSPHLFQESAFSVAQLTSIYHWARLSGPLTFSPPALRALTPL